MVFGHALRRILDNERTVTVHRRIDFHGAGDEHGVPAARAVANDTDASVGAIEPAQMLDGAGHIADQPLVGHTAGGTGRSRCVIRLGSRCLPPVEVWADGVVTATSQAADEFLCLPVVSGHVVNPHHAAPSAGSQWNRPICLDLVVAVSGDHHGFRADRVWADRCHRDSPSI